MYKQFNQNLRDDANRLIQEQLEMVDGLDGYNPTVLLASLRRLYPHLDDLDLQAAITSVENANMGRADNMVVA